MGELPPLQCGLVQCNQHTHIGFAIANHQGLADQGVAAQAILQGTGGYVLSSGGDNQILLPAGDHNMPGIQQFAQVTGVEPAFLVDVFGRGLRVVPVPVKQRLTPEQDLAVVVDAGRHTAHRTADRADHVVIKVHCGRSGGFRQAVALVHCDAHTPEKVQQIRAHS